MREGLRGDEEGEDREVKCWGETESRMSRSAQARVSESSPRLGPPTTRSDRRIPGRCGGTDVDLRSSLRAPLLPLLRLAMLERSKGDWTCWGGGNRRWGESV